MPEPAADLHGSAPDSCKSALLLVDVINPLDFPEADQILPAALEMARRIAKLAARARAAKVPVIYANDNFGRWRSDQRAVIERCREQECRGRELAELVAPGPDDYFVLKPKHSAFYSSVLDTLLEHLGTRTIVLGGLAGNICVLFTANDAYMRDYKLVVPRDCCASNTPGENDAALMQMERVLKADTRASSEVEFVRE